MDYNKLNRSAQLLLKKLTGSLSPEESAELQQWLEADALHRKLLDNWNDPNLLAEELQEAGLITDELVQQEKAKLAKELWGGPLAQPLPKIGDRATWLRRIMLAASVLLVACMLLLFYYRPFKHQQPQPPAVAVIDMPQPGSDKAILVLRDGRRITLDTAGQPGITPGNNIAAVDASQGTITYGNTTNDLINTGYNTLMTPKGSQYKLQLADGSLLHLNAASSVTYPLAFTGDKREITVTGEVYLQVAKDKTKPFIVHVQQDYDIQVLGTSFVINAYSDEPVSQTTLEEGAIRLTQHAAKGSYTVNLSPGQQAQVYPDQQPVVKKANIADATAFVRGLFYVPKGSDIRILARQLGRWYNVEVVYEGKVPVQTFTGEIDRQLPLADVLDLLKQNGLNITYVSNKLIIKE